MAPTTSANYQAFEGIWFDDLVVTGTNGTYRRQAWDFKRAYGLRSPGFTVRVIREKHHRHVDGLHRRLGG